MEHIPGVYTVVTPSAQPAPLVVEAPRSGREYPADFLPVCSMKALHKTVSPYVEEIYAGAPAAGATLLWANFPNSYIDNNRALDDIDNDMLEEPWPHPVHPTEKSLDIGIGLIHKWGHDDVEMYDRKLSIAEVQHRIDNYYLRYHDRLEKCIDENQERFGKSWHFSCHRMASIGPSFSHDRGKVRKDICLGDQYSWDADTKYCDPEFVDVTRKAFEAEGFSVSYNDPFPGMECIRRHGDPARGRHSLQIEMAMGLFLDPETVVRRPQFAEVQEKVARVMKTVADYTRSASA